MIDICNAFGVDLFFSNSLVGFLLFGVALFSLMGRTGVAGLGKCSLFDVLGTADFEAEIDFFFVAAELS